MACTAPLAGLQPGSVGVGLGYFAQLDGSTACKDRPPHSSAGWPYIIDQTYRQANLNCTMVTTKGFFVSQGLYQNRMGS